MTGALALAALIQFSAPEGINPRPIFLPSDTLVVSVQCAQWERWRKGNQWAWRANFGAVIETDTGPKHLQSGDVTVGSAPDLWSQLEWQCSAEYGAGIMDGP